MEDKRKYHIIIGSKAYFDASLPDFSEDMLAQELQRRFSRDAGIQDAAESLRGLLNHKLIPVILKAAGIPVHEHTERISLQQTETLCRQIQTFTVP